MSGTIRRMQDSLNFERHRGASLQTQLKKINEKLSRSVEREKRLMDNTDACAYAWCKQFAEHPKFQEYVDIKISNALARLKQITEQKESDE